MSDQQGSIFEVFKTFLKLGLTSFGGPVAHIGYFRKALLEQRQWLTESQFTQLLAICQFLPGPASSQLGFAIGLLRAGWGGAIAAFLAFTLPSALLLIVFASLLPTLSGGIGAAAIHGLKLVACAVVADAVLGMSKKLCPDFQRRAIALFAIGALLLLSSAWSQLLVVAAGAVAGMVLCREAVSNTETPLQLGYSKSLALVLLTLFTLLLLGLPMINGDNGIANVARTFFQAGALVFGGGHVVLPLLEQSVVTSGWVSPEHFLAGYGASQAIPGPMFAFAAYLGTIIPVDQSPLLIAATALLFIFLPGFLLVTAALPLWQAIAHNPKAVNAIAGLNAAVVGILAAALYDPIFTAGITSIADLLIAVIGFAMLTVWKRSPLMVVPWCVAASLVKFMLGY